MKQPNEDAAFLVIYIMAYLTEPLEKIAKFTQNHPIASLPLKTIFISLNKILQVYDNWSMKRSIKRLNAKND